MHGQTRQQRDNNDAVSPVSRLVGTSLTNLGRRGMRWMGHDHAASDKLYTAQAKKKRASLTVHKNYLGMAGTQILLHTKYAHTSSKYTHTRGERQRSNAQQTAPKNRTSLETKIHT